MKEGEAMHEVSNSIEMSFLSEDVRNTMGNGANVVDVLHELAHQTNKVARAIYPFETAGADDATGGHVRSLTEAVMGVTAGLCQIASAIEILAKAVRNRES